MKASICLSVLFYLLFPFFLLAQNVENGIRYIDKVHLTNGSVLIGKVLQYDPTKPEGTLIIEALGLKHLVIPNNIVRKVVQEPLRNQITYLDSSGQKTRYPKAYQFKEKGWYKAIYLQGSGGGSGDFGLELGVGASAVLGYQWNRHLGVGLGFDWQHYSIGDLATHFNTPFVEIRSFTRPRNVSPYYRVGIGYGFLKQNTSLPQYESSGGAFFYPAIGLRLGGSDNINASFDVGVRFQKVHNTYKFDWEWGDINYLYRRTSIRFGVLF